MIVDLNLNGKCVIVVGGGTEGVRKVHGLLGQNCKIVVISNRINRHLLNLSKGGEIQVVKAKLNDADILSNYKNPFLILAATNNKLLNRKLVDKGRQMGSFVYASDDPTYSDFSYTSIINIEGTMQVAISTSGKSPIMARKVRMKAERILRKVITRSDIENTKLQEFARNAAKPKIKTVGKRKEFLYSIINDQTIQNLIKEERFEHAKSITLKLLEKWENKNN